MADIEQAPKKRPGRPRKKQPVSDIPKNGISKDRQLADTVVEFMYDGPELFKRIYNAFNLHSVNEIKFIFDEETITILALDHREVITLMTVIYCKKINHYFCKERHVIGLNRNNIKKFKSITKKHTKIDMYILEKTANSKIHFSLRDGELDSLDAIDIRTIEIPPALQDVKPISPVDYPLKFALPLKKLKDIIADVINTSDLKLCIEKNDGEPLTIFYSKEERTVDTKSIFDNERAIDLECNIEENDLFSIVIKADLIKPFANSPIGSRVEISAHKTKNIILHSWMDDEKTASMTVSVPIEQKR